ncbi:MAG: hypothetical protein ACREO8_10160 [Luteimonas sp.]
MDPNEPASTADTPGPAPAAVAGDPSIAAIDADLAPVGADADSLAAIDKAISEADGVAPAEDTADLGKLTDKPGQSAVKDSEENPRDPAAETKNADDAALDAEAKELGLKGKATERFRGMAAEIKTLAPYKAELERAGIKDIAELPKMVERARAADDMIAMVMDTGTSAEQYGQTLDYLGLVNKATQGDRAAAEKAFEIVGAEYAAMAKALGKEVPGIHDPLAQYPDLLAEIGEGDLTRARALEIATQRTQSALQTTARQQTETQTQASQAVAQATGTLAQYDAQMIASDPAYAGKRDALSTMVAFIKQSLPPGQWLAATQAAYARIPVPAVAAAAPERKVPVSSIRPGVAHRPLTRAVYDDPMDAMDAALEAVNGR